jgi:hypothetical protein
MERMECRIGGLLSLTATLLIAVGGCSKEVAQAEKGADSPKQIVEKKATTHSSWWCDEHGLPEAECSMCNSKVAAEHKKAGDWCEKHDRAKSQCFLCDPSLKEKYATIYRAKYGQEPPEPTE